MERTASYAVAEQMQDGIGDMGVSPVQERLVAVEACARLLAAVVREPMLSEERAEAEQMARRLGLWPGEGK